MINRILVPLDLSDYAEAATQRACEISKAHRAQVMGMVVVNTPELMGRRFGLHRLSAETENVKAEQLRRLQQRVELGLGKFRETCDQARVTFVGDQVEGLPEDRLLEAAMYHDLIVVGMRTHFDFEDDADAPTPQSIGKNLGRTSTPILIVPAGEQKPFKKALIAFDGSYNAARTLRDFLDFQQPLDIEITVVTADPDRERGEYINQHALARIRSAGVSDPQGIVTEGDLQAVYDEELSGQFDLVVAGIHADDTSEDTYVGSFTNNLILDGQTALFLGL